MPGSKVELSGTLVYHKITYLVSCCDAARPPMLLSVSARAAFRALPPPPELLFANSKGTKAAASYFSLLEDAPPEHQWVFRELFLYGRSKEQLALQSGKDLAHVSRLLRECLGMIRKNLG